MLYPHSREYGHAHYRRNGNLPDLWEGPFHHILRFLRKAPVPHLPEIRHVAAGLRLHPDEGFLRGLRDESVGESVGQHDGLNKYPPAKPEVLRLLAPQRGLTAIERIQNVQPCG
jgi:hypothetical protein